MSNRSGKKLSCAVCQNEIPQSSKETPEGAEYVRHFCSTECKNQSNADVEPQAVAEKIAYPERFYDDPYAVLQDSNITDAQKLKVLISWENDALEILKADEENMSGETRSRLSEVKQAIIKLRDHFK